MARLTQQEKRRLEIERYLASGGSDDDSLVKAARQRQEEFAAQEEQARRHPDFSDVEGGSRSTEIVEAPEEISRFKALREQMGGEEETTDAQDEYEELASFAEWADPAKRDRARGHYARKVQQYQGDRSTFSLATEAARKLDTIRKADELFKEPGLYEAKMAEIEGKIKAGQARSKTAEDYYGRTGNIGTRTVGDILSQEESALPIIGGMVGSALGPVGATVGASLGAIPMADLAYDSAYYEARSAGVSEDEARGFARAMSGSEFLLEAAGGKAISAIGLKGLIKDQLESRFKTVAGKTVARTGMATAAGAAEEAATTALQMAGATAYGATDFGSKELDKVLEDQVPRNEDGTVRWSGQNGVLDQVGRSALAGGGQAVGPGAIQSTIGVRQEDLQDDVKRTTEIIINASKISGVPVSVAQAAAKGADAGRALRQQVAKTPEAVPQIPVTPPVTPAPAPLVQEATGTPVAPVAPAPVVAPPAPVAEVTPPTDGSVPPVMAGPAKPKRVPAKPLTAEEADPTKLLQNLKLSSDDVTSVEDLQAVVSPRAAALQGASDDDMAAAVQEIATGLGYKDAKAALHHMRSGKVRLVRHASQMPGYNGSADRAAGTFSVSNGQINIDVSSFKGSGKSLGGVLLHEFTHKARFRGAEGFTKPIAALVGPEKAQELATKLETLAKTNPIVARGLRAAKRAAKGDNKVYLQEAVEYVVESHRMAREKATGLGTIRNLYEDVRNAVSSRAAQFGLGEMKVTPETLEYLARQTMREDVGRGPDAIYKGGRAPLKSIVSGGTNEATAIAEGRTWLSADGARKYEIDDSRSRMTIPGDVSVDKTYKAPDIISHDKLFDELPELRDVDVVFVDEPDSPFGAAYVFDPKDRSDRGTIKMNLALMGADANDFDSNIHRYFIHELQHAAQQRSGTTNGANPFNFLSPRGVKLQTQLQEAEGNLAYARMVEVPPNELDDIVGMVEELRADFDDEYRAAVQKYKKVLGEQEAYSTMSRLRLSDESRRELATGGGPNLEQINAARAGGIYSARGKRLDKPTDKADALQSFMRGERTLEEANTLASSAAIDDVLASSIDIEDIADAADVGWRVTKRLLTPTSGFGHILNEKRLFVRNFSASTASRGEVLGYTLKNAIQAAAKDEGKSESQFRDELEATLERADSLPTKDEREEAMRVLLNRHPDLIVALNKLRDFKWELTQAHIAQRALDPKKLDRAELNLYKRMVKNAETYGTRAYLATLGGQKAAEYGKQLLRRAKKDPNSAEGKKLAVAIDYLIDNGLVIPDRAGLDTTSTKKLRVLYGTWVGDGAQLMKGKKGRAIMISKLNKVQRANRAELEAKAMEVVKELLGQKPVYGPVAKHFREAKQNRTILTSRKKMPKQLRELMGEITDPYLKEMLSVARLTQLVAKTNLLTEIHNEGKGNWWSDKESAKYPHKLSSPSYGPLNGAWVTKDTLDLLADITLYNNSIDQMLADVTKNQSGMVLLAAGRALPAVSKLASWQKVAQLVMSPMAMAYNFVGAFGVVAQNGIINPVTAARGMKDALEVVVSASYQHKSQAMTDRVAKVLMAGVMDSAQVGEFQGKVYQDIFAEIKRLNADDKGFSAKAMNIAREHLWNRSKNVGGFLKDFYAFMDVWAKVATFYDRESYLTEFYKAEGIPKTEIEIVRQAGYESSLSNISYNMALPLARIAERNIPVFTMFLTYFTEVPRSLAFSYAQVYKDAAMAAKATSPKARALALKQATTRLIGTTMVTAGLTALVNHMLDDEDETEERQRKLDPEWERENIRLKMGEDDAGNGIYLSIGRFDANGPLNEVVRRVMRAKEGEKAEALMAGVTDLFVKSKSIMQAAQVLTDFMANPENDKPRAKGVSLRAWQPELTQAVEDFFHEGDLGENLISFIDTTFVPAAARPWMDPAQGAVAKPESEGTGILATTTRFMGNKPYVRDPDLSLSFRASDYKKSLKALGKDKEELLERLPRLDEGELTTQLGTLIQAEREAFHDLHDAYDGYLAYEGRTHSKAAGVFEKKVNKETVAKLRTGEFSSTLVTPKVIDAWYKEQLKAEKPDRERLREMRALLKRAYTGVSE